MTKSLGNYSGVKSSNVVDLSAWLGLCSQLNFHFCLFVLAVWSRCLTTRTKTQGQRCLCEARDAGDQWTWTYCFIPFLSDSAALLGFHHSSTLQHCFSIIHPSSFTVFTYLQRSFLGLSICRRKMNLICPVIQIQWLLCAFGMTVSGIWGRTFHLICLCWV